MKNVLYDLILIGVEIQEMHDLTAALYDAGYDVPEAYDDIKKASIDCSLDQLGSGILEARDIITFLSDYEPDDIAEAGRACEAAPESINYILSLI